MGRRFMQMDADPERKICVLLREFASEQFRQLIDQYNFFRKDEPSPSGPSPAVSPAKVR